jgi:acyl carrier protein
MERKAALKKPTPKQIEKELKALIAEIAEVDESRITKDARFVEDLGMDSMMALEVLASIEKRYKIQIPEELLPKLTIQKEAADITKKIIKKISDESR